MTQESLVLAAGRLPFGRVDDDVGPAALRRDRRELLARRERAPAASSQPACLDQRDQVARGGQHGKQPQVLLDGTRQVVISQPKEQSGRRPAGPAPSTRRRAHSRSPLALRAAVTSAQRHPSGCRSRGRMSASIAARRSRPPSRHSRSVEPDDGARVEGSGRGRNERGTARGQRDPALRRPAAEDDPCGPARAAQQSQIERDVLSCALLARVVTRQTVLETNDVGSSMTRSGRDRRAALRTRIVAGVPARAAQPDRPGPPMYQANSTAGTSSDATAPATRGRAWPPPSPRAQGPRARRPPRRRSPGSRASRTEHRYRCRRNAAPPSATTRRRANGRRATLSARAGPAAGSSRRAPAGGRTRPCRARARSGGRATGSGTKASFTPIGAKPSAIVVATCSPTKTIESSVRFRWRSPTAKRGQYSAVPAERARDTQQDGRGQQQERHDPLPRVRYQRVLRASRRRRGVSRRSPRQSAGHPRQDDRAFA